MKAAAESGAFTIAVTTGPIPRQEMERAGATVIYDSMPALAADLPALLLQLFTVKDCCR